MNLIIFKFSVTAAIIVIVSEIAKRSTTFASLTISLPLSSLLAFFWIYWETKDANKVASMAREIPWLILPSLVFFFALPWLLRAGINFYISLGISALATAATYGVFVWGFSFLKTTT